MANKTVAQLATLSGVDSIDLLPVYDFSEPGIEKLKHINVSDFQTSIGTAFAAATHIHVESDITNLDKYTQGEVITISGVLQSAIDGKSDDEHDHDSDYAQLSSVNTFSNNQVIANNKGLYIKDTGAANRPMLVVNDSDQAEIGHVVFPLEINTNGTLTHNGNAILTTADEGSGNGIDADTLDGNEAAAFAAAAHTHDDRYYTENEVGSLLSDKSDTSHEHDTLEYSGNKSIEASSAGVNIYEPATPANFGGFGFSGNELYIGNKTTSASVHLYGKNSGDATVNIVHGDPDGATEIYHAGNEVITTLSYTNARGIKVTDEDGEHAGLVKDKNGPAYFYNAENGENVAIGSNNSSGTYKDSLVGDPDGATEIYYTGNKKLETASNGIKTFGHILPDMTTGASGTVSAHDIGSPTAKIRNIYAHDAYIDAGSLYVNNKKVIEDDMEVITISTDEDQHVRVKTTGDGNVYLDSQDEVHIDAEGGVQVVVPSDHSTKHMNFTNESVNGNITFSADGTGGSVQFTAVDDIDFTSTGGEIKLNGTVNLGSATVDHGALSGLNDDDHTQYHTDARGDARYLQLSGGNVTGNVTIAGNFTVSGTTTTVDAANLQVTDKVITVNDGEVGAGLTGGTVAGMRVDRGSLTDYRFVFDETQDNFRVGEVSSEQAVATREDTPTNGYVPVWDDATKMFNTASGIALASISQVGHDHDADYETFGAVSTHESTYNHSQFETAYSHSQAAHAPSNADNTAANETSHADVLVDGDIGVNVASQSHNHDASYATASHNHDSSYLVNNADDETTGRLTMEKLRLKNESSQLSGTFEVGNTPGGINPAMYNGYFYATRVYNAIWNDIADFQPLAVDQEYKAGKCYFDTLNGAELCNVRCQKSVIGILSDTFGFGVGNREADNYAPFAIAGWVLAYVVGENLEPGDVLTNGEDGSLVKMNQQEKSMYPERIVAIYKKPEDAEFWGPEGSQIPVDGRHWVKVK
jgi:hypothetical protein